MGNPYIPSEIMGAMSEKINQELEQYKAKWLQKNLKPLCN